MAGRIALIAIDMQVGMADRIASGSALAVPEASERVAGLLLDFAKVVSRL